MTADAEQLKTVLHDARTIAVVGLSPRPWRPSHRIASYLQEAGYRIVPVRPDGEEILGEPVHADLGAAAQAAGPIDIVDIFRRSETIPELLPDLLAIHPRLVWMQSGVSHPETAAALEAAGIPVVMDRCLMVEHSVLVTA